MTRTLLLATAAALIAMDGYVHGVWTNRWKTSWELADAVARLPLVSMHVGDWEGQARAIPEQTAQQAGFAGYLLRRYQKHQDGSAVTVLLACGPAGPLSVHTPSTCYQGVGYELAGEPVKQVFAPGDPPRAAELWKAKFTKTDVVVPVHLRIFYAWHGSDAWAAAANPRLAFGGLPVIHKLYVTCEMTGSDERQADEVCTEFMNLFLPELELALFARPS